MVVHGNGLDEITLDGTTTCGAVVDGNVVMTTIDPTEVGLSKTSIDKLRVDGVEQSAAVIRQVLDGKPGAARDIVCLNAAAALVVADVATDLAQAVEQAQQAIDDGQAKAVLDQLVAITNGS